MKYFSTILAVAAITMAASLVGAAPEKLELCQMVRGFAGTDHYSYTVSLKTAFGLRANEGLVFVLRTPAEDDTVPQAQISATYNVMGAAPTTVKSDTTTGVLQLGASIGMLEHLSLIVSNLATNVDTPFVLYSYHANYASCGVEVRPDKLIAFPLTTNLADTNPAAPATGYFAMAHPPGMDHYSITIVEGGLSANLATAFTLSQATIWVPAPNTGVAGDLPVNPTPATPQTLYLQVTPNTVASPATLRFQVTWTKSNSIGPAPGGNTGVPGIVPAIPGATTLPAAGVPTPTTTDETAGTGGSVLWSMFVFLVVVLIAYFVARTAYNISQGEREFPKYIPHHEEIAAGIATCMSGVNAAAGKANMRPPFKAGSSGGRYDDVDQDHPDAYGGGPHISQEKKTAYGGAQ